MYIKIQVCFKTLNEYIYRKNHLLYNFYNLAGYILININPIDSYNLIIDKVDVSTLFKSSISMNLVSAKKILNNVFDVIFK